MTNTFLTLTRDDEPDLYDDMHRVASECHKALGCRDYSFMNCRVTEAGEIYVLEVNVFAAFNSGL